MWMCNLGFKKVGESCSEMTAREKIIQLRMLQKIRNSRSSDEAGEEEGVDGYNAKLALLTFFKLAGLTINHLRVVFL